MNLSTIRAGEIVWIFHIPDGILKDRLRRFGFIEGTMIECTLAKRKIVALEWMGTVIAMRRRDLSGIVVRA